MEAQLTKVWSEYRSVVNELYPPGADRSLLANPDRLDALVDESERLRALVYELLVANHRVEREELETAAYAAAAIDVRVGADVLLAYFPEEGLELGLEMPPPWPTEDRPLDEGEERLTMGDLLADADVAFGLDQAIGGSASGSTDPQVRANMAIGELVKAGTEGASAFGTSAVSAGVMAGASEVLDAIQGLDWLREKAHEIGGRLKRGLKLIELGLRKLAATVGASQLVELASEFLLIPVEEILWTPAEPVSRRVVRWAVRGPRAHQMTKRALEGRNAPPQPDPFDARLRKLCNGFAGNMRWAKRINLGLAIAGPVLAALSLGVSQVAVLGVLCVGTIVCLCNLADRLDTLPGPGWVPGVPSIAESSP